jgi:GT2 family glycosyltransferase
VELAIFINSAGPNVNFKNVEDTLLSMKNNIGIKDFGIYYAVDSVTNEIKIHDIIKRLEIQENLLKFVPTNDSWAYNFNKFYDDNKDKAKYFLYSHDDLEIKTENFFIKAKKEIEETEEKVGWVTFTSDGYYSQLQKPISNSVREGFSLDRFQYPKVFECHKFVNEEFSLEKLEYPKVTVKCHAPFPHLVMVSNESLKDIGYCSDWSLYTLLIDEDWGMEALKKGYNNLWIPDIIYTHPLRPHERKLQGLRFESEVHKKFYEKWEWNFANGNYSDQFIDYICKKFQDTNIPLTRGKNSYDWQYLRKK